MFAFATIKIPKKLPCALTEKFNLVGTESDSELANGSGDLIGTPILVSRQASPSAGHARRG